MGDKARQYKSSTIKRLFGLSGNECYCPTCSKSLIAEDGHSIIAKICHIEAAGDDGPRYNKNMSDDDRRNFKNLILLCDEHHTIIDNKVNESSYPTSLLCKWKKDHEEIYLNKKLTQTTALSQAVSALAELDTEDEDEKIDSNSFNIDEKIKHNSIKKHIPLIEEYRIYTGKIEAIYDELEKSGSFKKDKLMKIIRTVYLKVKGKYVNSEDEEIQLIQRNSDNIIDDIEESLLEQIDKLNLNSDDAFIAIPIIMVDAFMRCKILEKPL